MTHMSAENNQANAVEVPLEKSLFSLQWNPEKKSGIYGLGGHRNRFPRNHSQNSPLQFKPGKIFRTEALPAMNSVDETQLHQIKATPPQQSSTWLPMVHIMFSHLKRYLNGTFHGLSLYYLQEYLDEFCYRFNRRFWELELPLRLLNACLTHLPVRFAENY